MEKDLLDFIEQIVNETRELDVMLRDAAGMEEEEYAKRAAYCEEVTFWIYRQRAASGNAPLAPPMPLLIVTRHQPTVEWLKTKGVTGEVVSHVHNPEQVKGRIVVGNLPFHLASEARAIGSIELVKLRPEQRGKELSVEEMEEAGARITWYVVSRM